MKSVPLNAFPRALARRAGAKKLRESGRIPAIIYGRQTQPQNLEINAKEMEDLIHHSISENLLVDLTIKDNEARPQRLALVQEVQHHPLSGKVLHVDFHEIAEDEKVTVSIPVETVGEAEGVKNQGGVLEHVLFKVKARGQTEYFDLNITDFNLAYWSGQKEQFTYTYPSRIPPAGGARS